MYLYDDEVYGNDGGYMFSVYFHLSVFHLKVSYTLSQFSFHCGDHLYYFTCAFSDKSHNTIVIFKYTYYYEVNTVARVSMSKVGTRRYL